MVLVQSWRNRRQRPAIFRSARWVLAFFILETLVQVLLLLGFGFKISPLVVYTVTMAVFWSLLVGLGVAAGMEDDPGPTTD